MEAHHILRTFRCVILCNAKLRNTCDKKFYASDSNADYCVNLVRQNDYENYLCTLLLPRKSRTTAFAIRAFNVELARIQEQVTSPHVGQMRMTFWQEALNTIYKGNEMVGEVPEHPVVQELYRAVKKHELSKWYLQRLISSRLQVLEVPVFQDLEAMEVYAEHTTSAIYYLILEASELRNVKSDHVASHIGKAQGLTNLVRAIPHDSRRNQLCIPHELLSRHSASTEMFLRGRAHKQIQDVVYAIAERAKLHLNKARSLKADCPSEAFVVFLPSVPVDLYLENLRRTDFDVFNAKLTQRNNLLPVSLYWNKLRSRY